MEKIIVEKPYQTQVSLSQKAKAALKREKGRRLTAGNECTIVALASEIIEHWAATQ